MKAPIKAFSALIVGALAMLAVLTPTAAQEATGTVSISVRHCTQLEAPAELPGDPAEGCVPGPGNFTFYLVGDGTNEFQTLAIDDSGKGSIDLPVGEYEIVEENTQVIMRAVVEEGQVSSFVFGFPREEPVPEPEVGTLNVNTFACPNVEAPMVTDIVGDDCVRVPAQLSFYLVGDGSGEFVPVTTNEAEATVVELPVGDYEVIDEGTQTSLFASVAPGAADLNVAYPMSEEPDPEVGTLNVNTFACPNVEAPMVTDIVGDDCVRVPAELSFYLVGDGTDDFVPVVTNDAEATVIDLPLGDYEIVDEATQATLFVSVAPGVSDLNIAYPLVEDPGEPTPAPTATSPVTKLPETGTGSGNNLGAFGALIGGAVITAGAIGVRIRKS